MSNFSASSSDGDQHSNETQTFENQGYLFFSSPFTIFLTIALIIAIVAAIIGNTLVLIATCMSPNLRKATTSLFIMSLAVSDLLTAILSIPFDIDILQTNGLWFHGEALCNLWTTAYLLTVPTSNLTLLVLSIDRYLRLREPPSQFREGLRARKRILLYVAALWIYSLVFALLPQTGWKLWRLLPNSVNAGICFFNGSRLHNVVGSVLHFIVPTLAMCVIYITIYRQIRRHTPLATQTTRAKIQMQRNIRAAKRIAIIVSVFLLCWVPYSIISIVGNLCIACFLGIPQQLVYITLAMGYSNSALNPILYSFNNRHFIDAYKRLYRTVRRAFA